jgi:hypothetical protein
VSDPVNQEIIEAVLAKLLMITGIGKRVYDGYLDISQVEGTPALCIYATNERTPENLGVSSTRRKQWDMTVGIVGYVRGDEAAKRARELARDVEVKLETDPTLGLGNVEQCRIVERTIANVVDQDPQFGFHGMIDLVASIRYRYVIGSP